MRGLIEVLNKRIALMKEQGMMPDLIRELEVAVMRIEQLERENKEIKAHVERLDAAKKQWHSHRISTAGTVLKFVDILRESPQTSLAEVRASAVEGFAESLVDSCVSFEEEVAGSSVGYVETGRILKHANQHAQQIRNGD